MVVVALLLLKPEGEPLQKFRKKCRVSFAFLMVVGSKDL